MCGGTPGPPPKSLDSDENFKPNIRYFVAFWIKTVLLGQEVHYYMVYIAYYTELDLQICNYGQKRCIRREKVNTRLRKVFMAIFAFDERLPTSATLSPSLTHLI